MKKILTVLSLALCVAINVGYAYTDPNPFAGYDAAMRPDPKHPMSIEWQATNRKALDEATSDAALAAFVANPEAAMALCANVKPNYGTDAMVAYQIGAVSQYVMIGADAPWYAFWRESRDSERRIWTNALLESAAVATDDYVKEYFLDQLRWCGFPCQAKKVAEIAAKSSNNVKAFADVVIRELSAAKD